jgi:hypothetical protein
MNMKLPLLSLFLTLSACNQKPQQQSEVSPVESTQWKKEYDVIQQFNELSVQRDLSYAEKDTLMGCLYSLMEYMNLLSDGDSYAEELDDLLQRYDAVLLSYITDTCTFRIQSKHAGEISSPDKKIKIYCYNDLHGGTLIRYRGYLRYMDDKGKIYMKSLNDQMFYLGSDTITDAGFHQYSHNYSSVTQYDERGERYYVLHSSQPLGGCHWYSYVDTYVIRGNKLVMINAVEKEMECDNM